MPLNLLDPVSFLNPLNYVGMRKKTDGEKSSFYETLDSLSSMIDDPEKWSPLGEVEGVGILPVEDSLSVIRGATAKYGSPDTWDNELIQKLAPDLEVVSNVGRRASLEIDGGLKVGDTEFGDFFDPIEARGQFRMGKTHNLEITYEGQGAVDYFDQLEGVGKYAENPKAKKKWTMKPQAVVDQVKKQDQETLMGLASRYLKNFKSGKTDGATMSDRARFNPVSGGFFEVLDTTKLADSAKAFQNGEAKPEDFDRLARHLAKQQAYSESGMMDQFAVGLLDMTRYVSEMGFAGGITGTAKSGINLTAKAVLKQSFAPSNLVKYGLRTAAMPSTYAQIAQENLPEAYYEDGKVKFGKDPNIAEAFIKGYGSSFVEVFVEQAGGDMLSAVGGKALNRLFGKWRKPVSAEAKKGLGKGITGAFREAGIQSIPVEMMEERITEVVNYLFRFRDDAGTTGLLLGTEEERMQGFKNLLMEAGMITALKTGMKSTDLSMSASHKIKAFLDTAPETTKRIAKMKEVPRSLYESFVGEKPSKEMQKLLHKSAQSKAAFNDAKALFDTDPQKALKFLDGEIDFKSAFPDEVESEGQSYHIRQFLTANREKIERRIERGVTAETIRKERLDRLEKDKQNYSDPVHEDASLLKFIEDANTGDPLQMDPDQIDAILIPGLIDKIDDAALVPIAKARGIEAPLDDPKRLREALSPPPTMAELRKKSWAELKQMVEDRGVWWKAGAGPDHSIPKSRLIVAIRDSHKTHSERMRGNFEPEYLNESKIPEVVEIAERMGVSTGVVESAIDQVVGVNKEYSENAQEQLSWLNQKKKGIAHRIRQGKVEDADSIRGFDELAEDFKSRFGLSQDMTDNDVFQYIKTLETAESRRYRPETLKQVESILGGSESQGGGPIPEGSPEARLNEGFDLADVGVHKITNRFRKKFSDNRSLIPDDLPDIHDANNTRWFHGSKAKIVGQFSIHSGNNNPDSLYGPGFYLTDDPDLAESYKGKDGAIHEVAVNLENVINLEKPLTNDVLNIFLDSMESLGGRGIEMKENIEYEMGQRGSGRDSDLRWQTENPTGEEIRQEINEYLEDTYSSYSGRSEYWDALYLNLRNAGYEAFTHIGGTKKGKKQHRVLIVLDPDGRAYGNRSRSDIIRGVRVNPFGESFDLADEDAGGLTQENPGEYHLNQNGENVGYIEFGPLGRDNATAERMFPELVKPGEQVARTNGIFIEDKSQRGKGYGQKLYLEGMLKHGADWYYNSQTWADATNTLKALEKKGLIELHWWQGKVPEYGEMGGVHITRLTDKGRRQAEGGGKPTAQKYAPTSERQHAYNRSSSATIQKKGLYQKSTGEIQAATPHALFLAVKDLIGRENIVTKKMRSRGLFSGIEGVDSGIVSLDPYQLRTKDDIAATHAHEIGHWVDFFEGDPDFTIKRGNPLGHILSLYKSTKNYIGDYDNKQLREEMIGLSEYWRGEITESNEKYRKKPAELYADFFSAIVNDPAVAQELAPKTFDAFFENLNRKPQAEKAFWDMQEMMRDPILFTKRSGEWLADADMTNQEKLEHFKKVEEVARKSSLGAVWGWLNRQISDEHYYVSKAFKKGDRKDLLQDFRDLNRVLDHVHDYVNQIDRDVYNPVVESGLDREDLHRFLFYNRIDHGGRQPYEFVTDEITGEKVIEFSGELINPGFTTKEDAQLAKSQFLKSLTPEQRATLKLAAKNFYVRNFEVMKEMHEAGMVSDSAMQLITKNRYNYVRFQVGEHITKNLPTLVKQQHGTSADIGNTYDFTVSQMMAFIVGLKRNKARRKVVGFLSGNGAARVAKKGESIPKGEGKVGVYEKGVYTEYVVDENISNALNHNVGLDEEILGQALSHPVFHLYHDLFVRRNIGFLAANPVRDVSRTIINLTAYAKGADIKITAADIMRKLWDKETRKAASDMAQGIDNDLIDEVMRHGAMRSTFFSSGGGIEYGDYKKIQEQWTMAGKKTIGKKNFLHLFPGYTRYAEFMDYHGERQEALPKIAAYQLLIERGVDKQEAARVARELVGTPDTSVRGRHATALNAFMPYTSVKLADLKSMGQLMTSNNKTKMKYLTNVSIAIFLKHGIKMALMKMGWDKLLEMLTEYDDENYMAIPATMFRDSDNQDKALVVRVPLPDSVRFINAVGESLYDISTGQSTVEQTEEIGEIFNSLVFGGFESNLNPMMKITADQISIAKGHNPIDSYYKSPIINKDVFESSGHIGRYADYWKNYAPKKLGAINDVINILKLGGAFAADKATMEQTLKATPVINRYIKATNKGVSENDYKEAAIAAEERANRKLGLDEATRKLNSELSRVRLRSGDRNESLPDSFQHRKAILAGWSTAYYTPAVKNIKAAIANESEADLAAAYTEIKNASENVNAYYGSNELVQRMPILFASSLYQITNNNVRNDKGKLVWSLTEANKTDEIKAMRYHDMTFEQADQILEAELVRQHNTRSKVPVTSMKKYNKNGSLTSYGVRSQYLEKLFAQ